MQSGMLFDNFLLTHDLETALAFARATWAEEHGQEAEEERQAAGWADWVGANPVIFWGVCVASVLVLPLGLWCLCGRGPADASDSADDHDQNDADDDADPKGGEGRPARTKTPAASAAPAAAPAADKEGLRQRPPATATPSAAE